MSVLSLVANFEEVSVPGVHYTGAILAFGVGTFYLWLEVYSSHQMCPIGGIPKWLRNARLVLVSICSVCFLVTTVTKYTSEGLFHGK